MREPLILNWAGGEHPFLLRIGERLALEQACDSGVGAILARLMTAREGVFAWFQRDVTETLRLGLIGGGMDRVDAARLVTNADERAGTITLASEALMVLYHSLSAERVEEDPAEPDEQPKKKPI